jgi:tRNA(Ile)-lysidine synthase
MVDLWLYGVKTILFLSGLISGWRPVYHGHKMSDYFYGKGLKRSDFLPNPPHKVLVACSGGMDSVYLLLSLWALRDEQPHELDVLTCDHGLRPESRADAEWVRHLAWSLGLACHVVKLDVAGGREAGESVEMCARRLRREAYGRVARQTGADTVALGHHMDDQAETVLMRLCRGTGTGGAAGMSPVREENGLRFVRPLLGLRRETIRQRLLAWGRCWREDGTNADPAMTRNRVRHEVLPVLCSSVNSKSVEHLAGFAEQLRELETWAGRETELAMQTCWKERGLDLECWRDNETCLRERMVFCALERWGADPLKISRASVKSLAEAWAVLESGFRQYQAAGLRLARNGDRVSLYQSGSAPAGNVSLRCGEKVAWLPLNRVISCENAERILRDVSSNTDWRGTISVFCRKGDFEIRTPERGDRYRPMGLKGTAKVSDLLGGAKVPLSERRVWPVVVCGEEIVWVPGFRVAEAWKAGEEDILRLSLWKKESE